MCACVFLHSPACEGYVLREFKGILFQEGGSKSLVVISQQ